MSLSPWRFRCPGTANADGHQHTTWTRHAENPLERRYYCESCGSYYAELIDVKTGERRR